MTFSNYFLFFKDQLLKLHCLLLKPEQPKTCPVESIWVLGKPLGLEVLAKCLFSLSFQTLMSALMRPSVAATVSVRTRMARTRASVTGASKTRLGLQDVLVSQMFLVAKYLVYLLIFIMCNKSLLLAHNGVF